MVNPPCREDFLEEDSSDDEKETREGPGFQAQLPTPRTRPQDADGPPPDEVRFVENQGLVNKLQRTGCQLVTGLHVTR